MRHAHALFCAGFLSLSACGGGGAGPDVPVDPQSPWPKFRANSVQDGRANVHARRDARAQPWTFQTGAGIFSSPVVGRDETVYIGSADRSFYAIRPDGTERFHFQTGEIIDSSALLDDRGHVYFGSGDGHVYALDAANGDEIWRFQADDPASTGAFIRWFEGNVAIGDDGTLYAPNDNFSLYAIDRDTGAKIWRFAYPDQAWSSPAIDTESGLLFAGDNNLSGILGNNTFVIDTEGNERWSGLVVGTVAASPVFMRDENAFAVGGFDGYLRTYPSPGGDAAWSFGTRDHLYASPARLRDGTLIQAGADGSVYALDAHDGSLVWQFDTREPIRSSPAVDADDHVYFGGGDGRMYVLNGDGTLRFRMKLVTGDRNDVNSSPALGRRGAYVGAESGEVFFVPYDYCLFGDGLGDARCDDGSVGEAMPDTEAAMLFTTHYGNPVQTPPASVDANEALAFSLSVRAGGDTELAFVDEASLNVTVTPSAAVEVVLSADRRFLVVVPDTRFTADAGGHVQIHLTGSYRVNPSRAGLVFTGGTIGGTFDDTFDFAVDASGPASLPYVIGANPGDPTGAFELTRLAAPLPTILPSYNQIGFDSLKYIGAFVEGTSAESIVWIQGAKPDVAGDPVIDPANHVMFPVVASYANGNLTLENRGAFALEAYTLTLTFDRFRLSLPVDAGGAALAPATVHVSTLCSGVQFYGPFLQMLGFCNPVSDQLVAHGATLFAPHGPTRTTTAPTGVGTVTFTRNAGTNVVTSIAGSTLVTADHAFGLLLVDASTDRPVALSYGPATTVQSSGVNPSSVTLATGATALPASMRAYLLVDGAPAARANVSGP